MSSPRQFFDYARERYRILLRRRAGAPRPWTDDQILRSYRFCNIFREDDTTTQWIRQNITEAGYGRRTLGAMVMARWFNRISTLEALLPPTTSSPCYLSMNLLYSWADDADPYGSIGPGHLDRWKEDMRKRLRPRHPLVTGAYMVKTPAGMSKLEGLLTCLHPVLEDAIALHDRFRLEGVTLEEATNSLAEYPYLGPFMAYEIVTDLRHSILSHAKDIMTWASPGPGCTRGLGRVFYGDCSHLNRHRADDVQYMQKLMRDLLCLSLEDRYWPHAWPQWEMREVEHTLCEFDKYERARLGQGAPKQRYQGA